MKLKSALPISTILAAICSVLFLAGFLYTTWQAWSPIPTPVSTAKPVPVQALSDPLLSRLPSYDQNAQLPLVVDPKSLSRDNPFQKY